MMQEPKKTPVKVIAEDSAGNEYTIAYNDKAPAEERYTIAGKGLLASSICAASIPEALDELRAVMRNHGRCLLTFDMTPGQYVHVDKKGRP